MGQTELAHRFKDLEGVREQDIPDREIMAWLTICTLIILIHLNETVKYIMKYINDTTSILKKQ